MMGTAVGGHLEGDKEGGKEMEPVQRIMHTRKQ